jgi:riboflavin biosynthesis pyrimidine reductase
MGTDWRAHVPIRLSPGLRLTATGGVRGRYLRRVRQLLPTVEDVDPVRAYLAADRPPRSGRPWLALSMVVSLDGATAVDGRSGPLGGPADREVFHAVRAVADVVLVAAGTFRTERYGPPRLSEDAASARVTAGRGPAPARLAVVTSTLDLDLSGPAFVESDVPPIVFVPTRVDRGRVRAAAEVSDVRAVGEDRVDLAAALSSMAADGAGVVVCEGGPTLNGQLVATGAVDEVCMSIAPTIVGGPSHRMAVGAPPVDGPGHDLASLLTEDGLLFGRWVRSLG